MDSDTPSASWHPAMMPNNNNDEDHIDPKVSQDDLSSQPLPSVTESSSLADNPQPEQVKSDDVENPNPTSSESTFLDQFNDDHDSGDAAWDVSEPVSAPAFDTEQAPVTDQAPIPTESEPTPMGNTAKHSSTVSFARTVSHEMNFNDEEDDVEWNLQRTETDPFKFMPPTERTNSFPVVPQLAQKSQEQADIAPPSSQAQEIIQEVEQETPHADTSAYSAFLGEGQDGQGNQESNSGAFQQSVGGDLEGAELDETEARFEEGLPLIPRDEDVPESTAKDEPGPQSSIDPFADESVEGGGEDFFSQIQGDSFQDQEDSFDHALQRKSTTMVMGEATGTVDRESELATPVDEESSKISEVPHAPTNEQINGNVLLPPEKEQDSTPAKEDLDARWAAAFDDDDDDDEFLADTAAEPSKELDPADIFGSDDEGFLDDTLDEIPANAAITAPSVPVTQNHQTSTNGRYAPPLQHQPQLAPNPYAPPAPSLSQMPPPMQQHHSYAHPSSVPPMSMGYGHPQPLKPDLNKAQSFASKSKGGYQSPYDLPMEVVKPKKRVTTQQLPKAAPSAPPPTGPPRSTSMYSQPPPPSGASNPSLSPPTSSHSNQAMPSDAQKPPPQLRSKPSFFEDLPMTSRPRPSSRQSNLGSPSQQNPYGQLQAPPRGTPSGPPMTSPPATQPMGPPPVPSRLSQEQAAGIPSLVAPERHGQAPTTNNRYSPAPAQMPGANGAHPSQGGTSRYSPAPPGSRSSSYSAVPPPLTHQPRTSSPLAHFEVSQDGQTKLPSPNHPEGIPLIRSGSSQYEPRLTQEERSLQSSPMPPKPTGPVSSSQSRYSPTQARHTPPPPSSLGLSPSNSLSPTKRSVSNYAPQPASNMLQKEVNFAPPPRSQTQSPSAMYGRGLGISTEPVPRPSSPSLPRRWRGAPSISWGDIIRSPGEVKVKHMKDIQALEDRLAKFPGPLKGKSKKKETIAWLTAGIEGLERSLPNVSFQQQVSHEDKRAVERVILWKILRVFIENDGILEGNTTVDKAVRDIISPSIDANPELSSAISTGVSLTGITSPATNMQADAIDSTAVEQIRKFLMAGEREKAVWAAADKRLWGHAMLISNTVQSADLYRQVAQEFIKKEVNQAGQGNESSVDELVPVHALGGSQDALSGLDKWRETLGLALRSLGNLLSGYGRAEAAHICYIFARSYAIFGGLDDPNANFVLETEALQLSEVYEYGLTLVGGSVASHSCPHLAAYKLQHAQALQYCDGIYNAMMAQTKRSPYYNPILESAAPKEESSSWLPKPKMDSNSMWTKFNKFVAGDDEDGAANGNVGENGEAGPFARIAGGTPTISRSPSVSNFELYGTSGPSPTVPTVPATRAASRYAPMGQQSSGSPYDPAGGYNSAPRTSLERTSGEMRHTYAPRGGNPYAPVSDNNMLSASGYQPTAPTNPGASPYTPASQGSPVAPILLPSSGNTYSGYQPYGVGQPTENDVAPKASPSADEPVVAGYQPYGGYEPPAFNSFEPLSTQAGVSSGDYEAPPSQSSGFEPPSYEPGPADDEMGDKPRKKSFMDDDDDDFPSMKSKEKSKVDKDKENEEMFRKVAEEEEAKAASAKKGWGISSWFGGGGAKKEAAEQPNKAIKAKLGEASSFVYDPDLKRWVNKKPGAENIPAKTATPPPPRAGTSTPPPPSAPTSAPSPPGPPMGRPIPPGLNKMASTESLNVPGGAPMLARSVSNQSTASAPGGPPSQPPSRPATSLSNASSIDDLLGAAGPRKGGKKPRKSGRYVDVMAK
ncbi:Sec23-binding domain of Sec16-domain-containing protein [Xylariaceae sp. FL0016]|nr:Sec23-binding domain of Sec16-domain-containing protein [Xylariaceae sp. FL0016]